MDWIGVIIRGGLYIQDSTELVGYKIALDGDVYDIGLDDFNLLQEDLGALLRVLTDKDFKKFILVPRGNKLVHRLKEDDSPEISYGEVLYLGGYEYMKGCVIELKQRYNHFNKVYFNNRLPSLVCVRVNGRLKRAGAWCRRGTDIYGDPTYEIEYAGIFVRTNEQLMDNVLLHEMVHVEMFDERHSTNFMNRIIELTHQSGIQVTLKCSHMEGYTTLYLYECTSCDRQYKTNKRYDNSPKRKYTCKCGAPIYLAVDNS